MSQERVISIQHVSGVYKIEVSEEEFERVRSGIMSCVKGELNCFGNRDDNGNETFYPAELIRNSVITIVKAQRKNNLEKIHNLL